MKRKIQKQINKMCCNFQHKLMLWMDKHNLLIYLSYLVVGYVGIAFVFVLKDKHYDTFTNLCLIGLVIGLCTISLVGMLHYAKELKQYWKEVNRNQIIRIQEKIERKREEQENGN